MVAEGYSRTHFAPLDLDRLLLFSIAEIINEFLLDVTLYSILPVSHYENGRDNFYNVYELSCYPSMLSIDIFVGFKR